MDSEIKILKIRKQKQKQKYSLSNKYILFFSVIIFLLLLNVFLSLTMIIKKNIVNNIMIDEILNEQIKTKLISNEHTNQNNSEKIKQLKIMTNNNINVYKTYESCLLNDPDSQNCIYHLLSPKKVEGKKLILLGEKRDGCYVLLDDFENIKIAYSIGISTMIQFDDALAKRGIDVFMYDHTINGLIYSHPKFHWKKIGLCGKNRIDPKLKSLDVLIRENGHTQEKNMILKIDAVGEWDSLKDIDDEIFTQFKYIVIEFHFEEDINKIPIFYKVLKKIFNNHQAFYLRCQGRQTIFNLGNIRICKYLEVSYIIRNGNRFIYDDSIYPIFEFDFENQRKKEVIEMNLNLLKLF